MNQASPVWLDGMKTRVLAYQIPLVTPVKRWTMLADPETSSELGAENAWALLTVVLTAGLLSQSSQPP